SGSGSAARAMSTGEHELAAADVEERLERLRVLEAVHAAADRLSEAGPVSEIVDRAPAEACRALDLDRCVLSRIDDGALVAEAIHCPDGPEEAGRHVFADVMDWGEHVATPIVLEGRVIGFLHGDRAVSHRPLGDTERDGLWRFALSFADIFERAVLRRRLRVQRQELRQVASWADARTSELSDGAIDLAVERDAPSGDEPVRAQGGDAALRDLLTRRELDVLEHMVQGETNADIARALVVSEGTVKFHVKNI